MRHPLKTALTASVLWTRFGIANANVKAWKNVAVYPDLGLAYNRIKKNANTTVVMLLREMESGIVESRRGAKRSSRKFLELYYGQALDLRRTRFFVVVRNPYSRLLSAFLFRFREEQYRLLHGAFDLSASGFANFFDYLRDGGLTKDAHWDLQSKLMFLPLAKYDAVVRFESFKPGMLALLDSVNLAPPDGRLDDLYPADVNKKTSSTSRLQEFYTAKTARAVAELFAEDFKALEYSQEFPSVLG